MTDNAQKPGALIMSNHCSKVMQNRIEEQSDFETTVCDKPVEPLKRIKKCAHMPMQSKCECEGPLETVKHSQWMPNKKKIKTSQHAPKDSNKPTMHSNNQQERNG